MDQVARVPNLHNKPVLTHILHLSHVYVHVAYQVFQEIDAELGSFGPYFLGSDFSLVDVMFSPFLERMAASLPYFKGFECRSPRYPNLLKWYEAMDQRPAYRGIKSDYYTHCHDLPPQIGSCYSTPAAAAYAEEIDGSAWSLAASTFLEPMLPSDPQVAGRDAVRRAMNNHAALVRFACRGVGEKGAPSVSAPLADPNARPNEAYIPPVDSCIRLVLFAMLEGTSAAEARLISAGKGSVYPVEEVGRSLVYLRQRIGVPRDMTVHGAQRFRAHINWFIESIYKSSHMYDT